MPFRRRPIRRRRRVVKRHPRITFAKRVLRVVNKQREMKVSVPFDSALNQNVLAEIDVPNGNVVGIMPRIQQGSNEYNRIGNQVTLHKIRVNAYYKIQNVVLNNIQSRVMIRHMIVRQRNSSSANNIITGATPFADNTVLENAQPYIGVVSDYNTPLNRGSFIQRRQIKRIITAPVASAGGISEGGDNSNSFLMVTYTLTFGKGKKLDYATSGSTQPSNFGYFLMHSAAALGSNTLLPANTCVYNMTTTAYYTDS